MKKGICFKLLSVLFSTLIVMATGYVYADDIIIDVNEIDDKIPVSTLTFPVFSNIIDHSSGGISSTDEEYMDYKNYTASRYEYADMVGHLSEVSAVRLAMMGVFEKTNYFDPDGSMKIVDFLRYFLKVCGKTTVDGMSDNDVIGFIEKTNLFSDNFSIDYQSNITNELLGYILGKASVDANNSNQYRHLLLDVDDIDNKYLNDVLDAIALGLIEVNDLYFNPKQECKRSVISDGFYRLINAGARVIPLYNIGSVSSLNNGDIILKNTFNTNESATQFGFFTNYNKQFSAFLNFGKLTIDRTDFFRWSQIEKKKGVYTMPSFSNEKASHNAGCTTICNIDISANTNWNETLTEDHYDIPDFYYQDIQNEVTRQAAKNFLYAFVQEMLNELDGNLMLSIDYELDSQQAIWNNASGQIRKVAFGKWYVEACDVARRAAADMGLSDRLKLIVIYNNITPTHLLGVSENQWMIDIARKVDYIGIDTYQFYSDRTDPSYTIQNIRFLMNNYSLGKPVIVVENGVKMNRDLETLDEGSQLNQIETATKYYNNLFREFRFALEKGDFLNSNLYGFLVWSYFDTSSNSEYIYGITDSDNKLRTSGEAIKSGIESLYKQRQFNPSYLVDTEQVNNTDISITVDSGTKYQSLSYISKQIKSVDSGNATLYLKLSSPGTVYLTVNGKDNYSSSSVAKLHTIELKNLNDTINVIDVYFGAEKIPFTQTVEKIELYIDEMSEVKKLSALPTNKNLLSKLTPISIYNGYEQSVSTGNTSGELATSLWTNSSIKDSAYRLRMWNANGMKITYELDDYYDINSVLMSSGNFSYPHQTEWKLYISETIDDLYYPQNCVAYIKDEYGLSSATQFANTSAAKCGKYVGIKLIGNGSEDTNAYITEIAVYGTAFTGDANSDEKIDIRDIVAIKKYLSYNRYININAADYDRDRKIDATDLAAVIQVILAS